IAHLRLRTHIVVQERIKNYTSDFANWPHDGRQMPFRSVTIKTTTTPDFTPDPISGADAFWQMVNGQHLKFQLECVDASNKPVQFSAPLIFISHNVVSPLNVAALKNIRDAYRASQQ